MGKYVKYKRTSEILNNKQLQEKFDLMIADGWEIIHYNEKILDIEPNERIHVTMVLGKPNGGN